MPPRQVASSVHFGMKAFITLESLLEYFVFSTETLQHEDDLIAHSKVSKERPQVQRENNIPQFQAPPSSSSSFPPFSVFTAICHCFTSCSLTRFVAGIPSGWRGSPRRCSSPKSDPASLSTLPPNTHPLLNQGRQHQQFSSLSLSQVFYTF